jgi:hypothetical protein
MPDIEVARYVLRTFDSSARLKAVPTLAGLKKPSGRPASGCSREVVVWDVWCERSYDGTWHLDGACSQTPTTHLVREHCLKCERLRVSAWCPDCVHAYLREQEQQLSTGLDQLLWCHECEQDALDWHVIATSNTAPTLPETRFNPWP